MVCAVLGSYTSLNVNNLQNVKQKHDNRANKTVLLDSV
jgi:hypothetical protein